MTQLAWSAEDVIRAVRGQCLHDQTWIAHGVSIDSRTVKAGDLFVALQGPVHNGHDHTGAAFAAGAAAAIVAHQPSQVPAQAPLVFVDDTFKALQNFGQAGRHRATARIVAVTGSVGKTSSKEMLRLMLNAMGETYANEGSLNNHWGVPLSLARLPPSAHYGVFEIGMNHAGELTALSQQAQPHVALITTIEAVHLEFFAGLEDIADAKAEIFMGMNSDGIAVLNQDNPYFARLTGAAKKRGLKKILGFGRNGKSDARLLEYNNGDISAEIHGKKIKYRLMVPGEHLALNSLGALLAAVSAGGDVQACAAALEHYCQPKGRGVTQTVSLTDGDMTIIDESYNASPAAVRAAIRVLGQMTPVSGGRRILVLGDMLELGQMAPTLHADLAQDIVDAKIDNVFACGELMAHLFDALPPSLRGTRTSSSNELAPIIAAEIHAGDIITIKGSHSIRMDVIVDALKALTSSSKQKMAS